MRRAPLLLALALLAPLLLLACTGDDDLGDQRAGQLERAALDAGLDPEVAAFLGLLGRADASTWEVRYPGPIEGTELAVASRPPDRRIDVVQDGGTLESRLVLDGVTFECRRSVGATEVDTCEQVRAVSGALGTFDPEALAELIEELARTIEDYDLTIDSVALAGTEATCLRTTLRPGADAAANAETGAICAADTGVLLRVERPGETLEALAYTAEVSEDRFRRPDADD